MTGRSTLENLPRDILDAVHEAIREGVTIDEITARIRARGGNVSRAAVGRYTKRARELVQRQKEADRIAEIWVREIGEQPEGRTGRLAIETLRTLAMHAAIDLGEGGVALDPEAIGALALAMRRIEAAGKTTTDRELAIKREAKREAAEAAGKVARKQGISADTAAAIRAAIEGAPE